MLRGLSIILALTASITTVLVAVISAGAEAPANSHFERTWGRTDRPVADGAVSRTWMWGPEAFTGEMSEPYASSPGGQRVVQYFDKSRMEISHPNADPDSIWYVTNGLLVIEMMTGYLQTGDASGTQYEPAEINVAGDADDPTGPTYATFGAVRDELPHASGAVITRRIDRAGTITDDPSLAAWNVTAEEYVELTGHRVASPFWAFMNSTGTIYEDGQYADDALFQNPFYATGLPVTEAYWASVKLGGEYRDVLMQCFERRCLTYTPGNPEGWQVEAGNVGQHYYHWRYAVITDDATAEPTGTSEPEATATSTPPAPTATMTPGPTAEPQPTAALPNPVQVKAALIATAEELTACLSSVFTADMLLELAAGNPDGASSAINACLSNSLPSGLADALEPLVDRGVACTSQAMDDLSIEELNVLANGTPEQQQAIITDIAAETIDCLIEGI